MLKRNVTEFWSTTDTAVFRTVTTREYPDGVEVFLQHYREAPGDGYFHDADMTLPAVERGEGDREANAKRATRRARTQIRRQCRMLQCDTMLTLTYRKNMQDFDRLKRDWDSFRRRLDKAGLAIQYVATVERQARGALHLHVACRKFLPWAKDQHGGRVRSWKLLQSIWRSVVGRDNGCVDVRSPNAKTAVAKIAGYIAKYVGKALEEKSFNKKAYWASRGIPKPVVSTEWYPREMFSTVELLADMVHEFARRNVWSWRQYASREMDFHWFSGTVT